VMYGDDLFQRSNR